MLDANLKTQLRAYLERLVHDVQLIASLDASPAAAEMRTLLEELAELSPRVSARFDGQAVLSRVRHAYWLVGRPAVLLVKVGVCPSLLRADPHRVFLVRPAKHLQFYKLLVRVLVVHYYHGLGAVSCSIR